MFVPCKKCKCGCYNDISVLACDVCGESLDSFPVELVDTLTIDPMDVGEINDRRDYFVQTCTVCGIDNFSAGQDGPVGVCRNCSADLSLVSPKKIDRKTGSVMPVQTDEEKGSNQMDEAENGFGAIGPGEKTGKDRPQASAAGISTEDLLRSISSKIAAAERQTENHAPDTQKNAGISQQRTRPEANRANSANNAKSAFASGRSALSKTSSRFQAVGVYEYDDEDDNSSPWDGVVISGLPETPVFQGERVSSSPVRKPEPGKTAASVFVPPEDNSAFSFTEKTDGPAFSQKGPRCGTDNVTSPPNNPTAGSSASGKTNPGSNVTPVLYQPGSSAAAEEKPDSDADKKTEEPVYVQKCPRCGANNFTSDPNNRVTRCIQCNKSSVKKVDPVLYQPGCTSASAENPQTPSNQDREALDDDEDDIGSFGISDGIAGSTVSGKTESIFLGFDRDNIPVKAVSSTISFFAQSYGSYRFSLSEGESIILGREAEHAEFLKLDQRVGRKHCFISSRGGRWYVRDNNSQNGTFINDRDIGFGGEGELTNGCVLVLGHEPDSMAFFVSIT